MTPNENKPSNPKCKSCGHDHSEPNRPWCDRSDLEIKCDNLLSELAAKDKEIAELKAINESAVKGRSDFRQALKLERGLSKIEEQINRGRDAWTKTLESENQKLKAELENKRNAKNIQDLIDQVLPVNESNNTPGGQIISALNEETVCVPKALLNSVHAENAALKSELESWKAKAKEVSDTLYLRAHRTTDPDIEIHELKGQLETAVAAAELGLSFAPKGPVPENLAPMFYHTLNYKDECDLQKKNR